MALTARLLEADVISNGLVSFHGSQQDCIDEINDEHSFLSLPEKSLIDKYLSTGFARKKIIDSPTVDGAYSAVFGHFEYATWQKSFCHLVNETVFYDAKLHLTEKVFKPIVAMRPFVLAAAPGNLAYLRQYGFETFGRWIDESYDKVEDPFVRVGLLADEIKKICRLSPSNLQKLYGEMLPILEHNKNHFFGQFKELIVNELVDNFDTCIRMWNNGRVDGRDLPLNLDLAAIKKKLLS
jgi:hypothetical protein